MVAVVSVDGSRPAGAPRLCEARWTALVIGGLGRCTYNNSCLAFERLLYRVAGCQCVPGSTES